MNDRRGQGRCGLTLGGCSFHVLLFFLQHSGRREMPCIHIERLPFFKETLVEAQQGSAMNGWSSVEEKVSKGELRKDSIFTFSA